MENDLISRQDAIEAINKIYCHIEIIKKRPVNKTEQDMYVDMIRAVKSVPSAEPEPAIPVSWIEEQIKWLKSLDNAFSTLTAVQISSMVKKWKEEQDGRFNQQTGGD